MKKYSPEETERILQSLDQLKPAEVNPFLFEKIKNRLNQTNRISRGKMIGWSFAVGILLLVNFGSLLKKQHQNHTVSTDTEPMNQSKNWDDNAYYY